MNSKTFCPAGKIECRNYAGILIEENNPMCNARVGYCMSIAEAEQCPWPSKQQKIEKPINCYPMCEDQPAQIDCRKKNCIWHYLDGYCTNTSPAIVLSYNESMHLPVKAYWQYWQCHSFKEKP